MKAYIARIRAKSGVLLDGNRIHESAPFARRADAIRWTDVVLEVNRTHGREAELGTILLVHVPSRQVVR